MATTYKGDYGWPTWCSRFVLCGIKVSFCGWDPQNRDLRRKPPPETEFSAGLLSGLGVLISGYTLQAYHIYRGDNQRAHTYTEIVPTLNQTSGEKNRWCQSLFQIYSTVFITISTASIPAATVSSATLAPTSAPLPSLTGNGAPPQLLPRRLKEPQQRLTNQQHAVVPPGRPPVPTSVPTSVPTRARRAAWDDLAHFNFNPLPADEQRPWRAFLSSGPWLRNTVPGAEAGRSGDAKSKAEEPRSRGPRRRAGHDGRFGGGQ